MPLPLRWDHRPPRTSLAPTLAILIPIVLRAAAWSLFVVALAVGSLHLITPSVAMPLWLLIAVATLLPLVLLIPALEAIWPSPHRTKYVLDDTGLRVDRALKFRWSDALGWTILQEAQEVLLLVENGGKLTRMPLPQEPARSALASALQLRLPRLLPQQEALYSVAFVFSLREVLVFTLCAYVNALVAGLAAPLLLRFISSPYVSLAALVVLCLPTSLVAVTHVSHRYPQYSFLRVPLLIGTAFFTSGLALPFAAAFMLRAFHWYTVAA